MTEDAAAFENHECPNCGQTMALKTRIRRAFDDDQHVFQCGMCGTSKTVKKPKPTRRQR